MIQKEQLQKEVYIESGTDPIQAPNDCKAESLNLSDYNIAAIIPAYNEERFIGSVVIKTLTYCKHVIVVDDGSGDATQQVATLAGAKVLHHYENKGKGAALNTGFAYARTLNVDAVVLLDADGQHSPEEICLVLRPILVGNADIVLGSRYLEHKGNTPRHRVWGHWVFNRLTRLLSGVPASDSQSGFRALSPRAIETISFTSTGFSVESEMQFIIHDHNLKLDEVPVTIQYTDSPKRNVMSHGLRVLDGILRLMGQYRPLLFFGLTGMIVLSIGIGLGSFVIDLYIRKQGVALGVTIIAVILIIIGAIGLMTGVLLHSIRGLLSEFLRKNGK